MGCEGGVTPVLPVLRACEEGGTHSPGFLPPWAETLTSRSQCPEWCLVSERTGSGPKEEEFSEGQSCRGLGQREASEMFLKAEGGRCGAARSWRRGQGVVVQKS